MISSGLRRTKSPKLREFCARRVGTECQSRRTVKSSSGLVCFLFEHEAGWLDTALYDQRRSSHARKMPCKTTMTLPNFIAKSHYCEGSEKSKVLA
jgi:hypothetical protein